MQVTEGLNTGMHINYITITQVEYLLSIKGTPDPSMQVAEGLNSSTYQLHNSSYPLKELMQVAEGLNTSTGMHIYYITQI